MQIASLEYCQRNQLIVEVAKAMDIKLDSDTQSKLKDYQKSIKDSYDREGGYKKFLKDNNLTDDYIDMLASVSCYTDALMNCVNILKNITDVSSMC